MQWYEILAFLGIPTAVIGLVFWYLKRRIVASEKKQQEKTLNTEALILMMMQSTRANTVGITAIAKAVQRIPDAHCNGDMDSALKQMEEIQKKEQQFIIDKGIQHIFE